MTKKFVIMGKSEAIGVLKDAMGYIKDLQKTIEVYGTNGVDLYRNLDLCYNSYPSLKKFGDACNWITDSNDLKANEYLYVLYKFLENKSNGLGVFQKIYQTLLEYGVKCHAAKMLPTGKYAFLEDSPIFRAMFFLNNLRECLYRWEQLGKPFSEMDNDADEAKEVGTTINNTTNNYVTNNYDNRVVTNNYGVPFKEEPEKENGGCTSPYPKDLVELFNGHTDYIEKLVGLSDDEIASKINKWSSTTLQQDSKPICQKVYGNKRKYAEALKEGRFINCCVQVFARKL